MKKERFDELVESGMFDELWVEVNNEIDNIKNKKGRKSEVLEILKRGENVSIMEIGKELGISCKNVSSQLSYLRSDNYNICTDKDGKKFLV
jgi:biotin operon repressor